MMNEVPATRPDTMPLLLTVATVGMLELHVPPVVTSLKAIEKVEQTGALPVIEAGRGFTVITTVAAALPQLFVVV